MAWPRYQKTESGWQELQQRRQKLDLPSRQLLILCNGRASLGELRAQFGPRTDGLLQGLVERGLVEAVERADKAAAVEPTLPPSLPMEPEARVEAAPAPPPPPAPPASAPAPAPVSNVVSLPERAASLMGALRQPPAAGAASSPPSTLSSLPELRAAKKRALAALEQMFGPGGGSDMPDLLKAPDEIEFQRVLRRVTDNVAVYQGRKAADALARQIRGEA